MTRISAVGGVSVIVPAHNEAAVVGRCLADLLNQSILRPVRIIVVANGCTDETAAVARTYEGAARDRGFDLLVLELERGSKPAALNLGDLYAGPGVRVYLDADIRLSDDALSEVVACLESGEALLCAPRLIVASARSTVTRCYAEIWKRLPVVRTGVIGCGFYAVACEGRRRWGAFPEIMADDKLVRLSFATHERRVLASGWFTVQMPEGLRELVLVRGRWCRGNRELSRKFPTIARREQSRILSTFCFLLGNPGLWLHTPLFLLVFLLGHAAALRRSKIGVSTWERAVKARELLVQT